MLRGASTKPCCCYPQHLRTLLQVLLFSHLFFSISLCIFRVDRLIKLCLCLFQGRGPRGYTTSAEVTASVIFTPHFCFVFFRKLFQSMTLPICSMEVLLFGVHLFAMSHYYLQIQGLRWANFQWLLHLFCRFICLLKIWLDLLVKILPLYLRMLAWHGHK